MLELYSRQTPNGRKAAIALEESGLPYEIHAVDFARKEQKSPAFLALNPNGRIPVLVDSDAGDGKSVAVFESGAILLYVAEKSRRLLPPGPLQRIEALKWLFFASSQVTHIAMQVHWLARRSAAGEAAPFLEEYRIELARLYGVLEAALAARPWLAGETYSVADIAAWCWVERHEAHGLALDPWPRLSEWCARVAARPATVAGYALPPRAD